MGNVLSGAGEKVASAMAEKQQEAMKAQREAQKEMMMTQAKRMQATMVAQQRELLVWEVGLYGLLVTGVSAATIKRGHFPVPAIFPLVLMPYAISYQADLAYGTKLERIKAEADRILEEEAHWFTDVKPENSKKKIMTNF